MELDSSEAFKYSNLAFFRRLRIFLSKAINSGEGFKSVGWRFSPLKIFDHLKLITFLSGIRAIRMKAVFITSNGVFGYNLTEDALMEMELDDAVESRIEIISKEIKEYWDETLISCITDMTLSG